MSTLSTTNLKNPSSISNNIVLDSSGRVLVGAASAVTTTAGHLLQGASTDGLNVILARDDSTTASGDLLGGIRFYGNDGGSYEECASITAEADLDHGSGDKPTRLVFSTTADNASSPTERMRITNGGQVLVGTTDTNPTINNVPGILFGATNHVFHITRDSLTPVAINRKTNDGGLIDFIQDGTIEGNIAVSGSTVTLTGAHLSRWSQLPGGTERTEILRGTVLSNIDEMCNWGEEDNEQLNRMQVSDLEGDANVSGVFQAWDNDDDTYTDDFYCAMTGDFIIRIAEGTVVQRGDLLMSAGDGTAKPQNDDIIRSKTIAKVTSTHVTCTYDDGSYCVPCVLMAC